MTAEHGTDELSRVAHQRGVALEAFEADRHRAGRAQIEGRRFARRQIVPTGKFSAMAVVRRTRRGRSPQQCA